MNGDIAAIIISCNGLFHGWMTEEKDSVYVCVRDVVI